MLYIDPSFMLFCLIFHCSEVGKNINLCCINKTFKLDLKTFKIYQIYSQNLYFNRHCQTNVPIFNLWLYSRKQPRYSCSVKSKERGIAKLVYSCYVTMHELEHEKDNVVIEPEKKKLKSYLRKISSLTLYLHMLMACVVYVVYWQYPKCWTRCPR